MRRAHSLLNLILAAAFCAIACQSGARAQTEGQQATTQIIESLGGIPIALTHTGDRSNPSVLFVHGLLSGSVVWKKQLISDLRESYFLNAVDVRGHGSSGKPVEPFHYIDTRYIAADIAAAVESVNHAKVILVAHSYGGLFVMDYVRHYGTDSISGIVFVGANGGISTPQPKVPVTADKQAQIERSRSANIFTNTDWTTAFVDGYLLGQKDVKSRNAEMLRVAAMMVPHYVRRYMRQHNSNNLDIAGEVTVPVVFLAGENHKGATQKVLRFASDQLQNAHIVTLENQAHMVHWRAPDIFNSALKKALNNINSDAQQ